MIEPTTPRPPQPCLPEDMDELGLPRESEPADFACAFSTLARGRQGASPRQHPYRLIARLQ